jgi:hypothetical protein
MSSLMAGTLMIAFGIVIIAAVIILDITGKINIGPKLAAIPPEEVPECWRVKKVEHVFYTDDTNEIYIMDGSWRATQHSRLISGEVEQIEGLIFLGEL